MKIWIPGAGGLVGSELCSILDSPIVKTGREVDIADPAAVAELLEREKPTHIANCAAFSAVDPAETDKEQAYRDNAIGPKVLGLEAKKRGIFLLHLSTDYVFSGEEKLPLKETDPTAPCNHYGYTKWEGERNLHQAYPSCCILRTSWVYGPKGKNFVAKLVELLQTQEELRLVKDQISRPTYAADLAAVILQMLETSGLYQFANAGPTSKWEFALAMREEMEKLGFSIRCKKIIPCFSSEFRATAKRPLYSAFDTSKIEALGIKPRHWRQTLHEYLQLYAKTSC